MLRKLYASVHDIDLFVGCILEYYYPGAMIGPTGLKIIGEQFYRLKYGDRFWYEHKNLTHSFTNPQLKEIRKIVFSSLLCTIGDDITQLPRNIFIHISPTNPLVNCANFPKIDFSKWAQNERSC